MILMYKNIKLLTSKISVDI